MNDPNPPPGGQPWNRPQPPSGGEPPRYAGEPYGQPPPAGGTGLATTALVLGIFALCTTFLTGVPAAICGLIALVKGTPAHGRAIAGMVLGILGTLLLFPVLLIALLLPAFAKVREAAARAQDSNSLKQVALGFHNHESTTRTFPPADDGKVSWRVHLLPYVEQEALYRQFDRKQAWDGPANKRLADTRVPAYASKGDPETETQTHWRVFTGPKTLFPPDGPLSISRIKDGMSNTILTVETTDAVPWPAPRELPYTPAGSLPSLGHKDRPTFLVAMADGTVRAVTKKVSEPTLRAAITADGNDMVGPDWLPDR